MKSSVSLNDLRQISMFGLVHKLIAKVLAGRLRSIINQLVSHSQMAFICGRKIHDDWVIVFEVIDAMKKDKQGLIFKLDFKRHMIEWIGICHGL